MCTCPDRSHKHQRRIPKGTSRRDLLRFALGGAGIAALGPWLGKRLPAVYGAPTNQKRLIMLEMNGGCDTLNMVVPTSLPSYYSRRTGLAIPAAQTLALAGVSGSAGYALHPSMP